MVEHQRRPEKSNLINLLYARNLQEEANEFISDPVLLEEKPTTRKQCIANADTEMQQPAESADRRKNKDKLLFII
jgi:hypothetical protein